MEATKERREQMEKERQQDVKDPMGKAREIIEEAIISKSDYGAAGSEKNVGASADKHKAEEPEDVLAYSRAVHQKDSLLE
ncbi:hypothetical protein PHJA_001060300 [Phtheirospermum japonicum]|uniref:Uncharacterized protein n=1 Tax=Phtheirospermum japonicum TaxID=374723 RepID=A0A830BQQ0_9LAMI|nr:hypothetical protein PHJA_001060300 [Phtheirospermum japonicum]